MSKSSEQLRLQIEPVIQRADDLAMTVAQELPTHTGLGRVTRQVARASHNAQHVAAQLQRPFGLHRVPALFLLMALGAMLFWGYWHFLHISKLVIAISSRDAIQLKDIAGKRVEIRRVETLGSRESISMLQQGEADLAFVQGGIELPKDLLWTELEASEIVLFFVRERVDEISTIQKILTSSQGQGSHTLAQSFAKAWRIENQVQYSFDWRVLTDDPDYTIADDVDAILVVKDPLSEQVTATVPRLQEAGFRLASPEIGANQLRMPFLSTTVVRPGFLDPVAHIPAQEVASYSVATYLVARPDLTPRQMSAANALRFDTNDQFAATAFDPTFDHASEVAQGIEAIVGIVIYVGLAFLALLGLDVMAYRRHFNELNTLVSLISMHQSSKDPVTDDPELRQHNIQYLKICSDLLGLISVITGYYTQENASLLFNRLPEIIHDRCDALKINIQLKILHGLAKPDQIAATTQSDRLCAKDEQAADLKDNKTGLNSGNQPLASNDTD